MSSSSFDMAFERVKNLASVFQKNEKRYLSPEYSEMQARVDFIDKFWIALGWDVNHEIQTNPYEQEVKVERSIVSGVSRRRADYAFLSPNFRDVRFFVEAKKPFANVDTPDNYFQTIRYGWNAKTPLAVLTDFEQFRILDCRSKPNIDTALASARKKFHYSDYSNPERFGEIYYLFSREAVYRNAIENYTATLEKPNRKAKQLSLFSLNFQSVDESFLRELDVIREELATNFKSANQSLTSNELTEVVQRTIDRLVFMRFLEDKLIEPEPIFEKFFSGGLSAWQTFILKSRSLDRIYNGIIFKPHVLLDSPNFRVDDTIFESICDELSSSVSPFDFNAIPIHILGSIYERFLGKVITVDSYANTAKIEEKLEVRKAGGVYYTPEYIVQYIVENTVGKLTKGKTPEQISMMRFADIACGSGSFLIGAYDFLLRYHTRFYNDKKNRRKGIKAGCIEDENGSLRLSLRQRKEILLNNVYGVDLDAQAVEVAQLSLFLKLLEEETTGSARGYQMEFRETMLPSLDKNIVQGNSLIGWDIMDELFADNKLRELYPFDFSSVFPEVMNTGGFSAIIGNPPYGQILNKEAENYNCRKLKAFKSVKDVYVAFMERAPNLLTDGGLISFIVPSSWLGGIAYKVLREVVSSYSIDEIISLPFDVFKDAYVDTLIYVASKKTPSENHTVRGFVYDKKSKITSVEIAETAWQQIPFSDWRNNESGKFILSTDALHIIEKLKKTCPTQVKDFLEMKRGVLFDKTLLTESKISPDSHPYFEGSVYRYELNNNSPRWIEYGSKMREYPKDFKWFEGNRILMRRLVNRQKRLMSCIARDTFITNKNLYSLLPRNDLPLPADYDLFALGTLNSKLISMLYLEQVTQASKDDFPQVTIKDVLNLPMPLVSKEIYDPIVQAVHQIIETKKHSSTRSTDTDINFYSQKIAVLERHIDNLVYEIYELPKCNIELVEKFFKS